MPEATRTGVVGVVRKLIATVLGIKDKDGSFTIYMTFCHQVPGTNLIFQFAMQRVVPDPQVEQQHGQRVQVGLRRRVGLPKHHFGRHVLHGPKHLALRLPIDADIVVVTDENIARVWIEHQIAGCNVPIAVATQM